LTRAEHHVNVFMTDSHLTKQVKRASFILRIYTSS
jgi:hypothetical protein